MPLNTLPERLQVEVEKYQQRFIEQHADYRDWFAQCLADEAFAVQLARTWACSKFAAELCYRQPQLFKQLVDSDGLQSAYSDNDINRQSGDLLVGEPDEDQLNQRLRQFRALHMLRIIWRDINRLADLQETTGDISALAEACIQQALDFHQRQLSKMYGKPVARPDHDITADATLGEHCVEQCAEQKMVVLGMGKLGAWELNLSSDIDLIFCYPCSGETVGGSKTLTNSEFFTRVARKLIHSLDHLTADGFVFRVDMRLRPYGQSGALVLSFDAMEEYYQDQGRDWERYAMIKARVVAGDAEQGRVLMDLLRPFIYRRYIDFSAIESLRSMKQMIQQEVKRRRLDTNVKLGSGGIREIEFIAQSFQLIRGGRETDLQERRVQKVLALLAEKTYMPVEAVQALQQAYIFLRNTEHAIQAFNDQQTQTLPDTERPQAALAFAMAYESWDAFFDALTTHRKNVDHHFRYIISDGDEDHSDSDVDDHWQGLWLGDLDEAIGRQLF